MVIILTNLAFWGAYSLDTVLLPFKKWLLSGLPRLISGMCGGAGKRLLYFSFWVLIKDHPSSFYGTTGFLNKSRENSYFFCLIVNTEAN